MFYDDTPNQNTDHLSYSPSKAVVEKFWLCHNKWLIFDEK